MFRTTRAILDDTAPHGDDPRANARIDADLIMTAAVAGFCVASFDKDHPVEFGAEATKADDVEDLAVSVDLLNQLMPNRHSARRIQATATPTLSSMLITASANSAQQAFADRNIEISDETAQELHDLAMSVTDPIGYQGKGAYTGLVSDPQRKLANITSTARRNVPGDYGDRWVMPGYPQGGLAWGLIGGLYTVNDGMSEEPMCAPLVGYVHGMIQAIYRAYVSGPQCTPWEIAVGVHTTKLASCFACTQFMYANDYPPSCIHLGRADSWTPFYPLLPGQRGYGEMDRVFAETNDRWNQFCHEQLLIGAELLAEGGNGVQVIDDGHRTRLPLLRRFLTENTGPHDGGNLVLDALTMQEKVTTFINRTLVRA